MGYDQQPPRTSTSAGVTIVLFVAAGFVVFVGGLFLAGYALFPLPPDSATVVDYSEAVEVDDAPGAVNLKARLEAAGMISDSSARDEALAKVARDAADSGVVDGAIRAVEQIAAPEIVDDAAIAVAKALCRRGRTEKALEVVRRIQDATKRDEALRAIATGEWSDDPDIPSQA